MAIAGFKKIDATYHRSRDGAYALVKLGEGWAAFTEAESKDDMRQISEPTTQAKAAKATVEHKACTPPAAPCEPAPCNPKPMLSDNPVPFETGTPAAAEDAAPTEPAKPKERNRSRVDTTIDAMRRPEGVTVDELVVLFEQEHGNGKRSTASQAVFKVPQSRGLTVAKERVEDRGLVYRLAS